MNIYECFVASLNAVIPLALYLLIGYLLMRFKFFDKVSVGNLTKFSFSVLLPFTFFNTIRNADFAADVNLYELGIYILITGIMIVAGWLYGVFVIKEPNQKAPAIQAFFRSNCVIFALPIAKTLFDPSQLTTMVLYMALVIPFLNVLSVVALSIYGTENNGEKPKITLKGLLKDIVTSPIIVGTILGIIYSPIQTYLFAFPDPINKVLTTLGSMSTPLLLITVGAIINLKNVRVYKKQLALFTPIHMLVRPLVLTALMIVIGLRGSALVIGTLLAATPPPVATVGMAAAQKRDSVFAGLLVSFSSLISVVTIFLFVFLLGVLGFATY